DERGRIRGPAGTGRGAWVSREDVAAVAAVCLLDPPKTSGALDVTGPESLTFAETAARLGKLVGRELVYVAETREEGRAWRQACAPPDWEPDVWLGSHEAVAAGELQNTSNTVARIVGRPPYSLEAYFTAHPELLDNLHARST